MFKKVAILALRLVGCYVAGFVTGFVGTWLFIKAANFVNEKLDECD